MPALASGRLRHVSPEERCPCAACEGARQAIVAALSDPQTRALAALDRAIPRSPRDLRDRDGVQRRTLIRLALASADRPALVQLLELRQPNLHAPYFQFARLTGHGDDVRLTLARTSPRG